MVPSGFTVKHVPHQSGRAGGGVAVIYNQCLRVNVRDSTSTGEFSHFEYVDCQVTAELQSIRMAVVYCALPSRSNGLTNSLFLEEWSTFMERFTTTLSQTYILGTTNLHLDNASDGYASKFISVLQACGFDQ